MSYETTYDTALYKLLDEGFPHLRNVDGRLDIQALADCLDLGRQAVYAWFRRGEHGKISTRQVKKLLALDGCRLNYSDIERFL